MSNDSITDWLSRICILGTVQNGTFMIPGGLTTQNTINPRIDTLLYELISDATNLFEFETKTDFANVIWSQLEGLSSPPVVPGIEGNIEILGKSRGGGYFQITSSVLENKYDDLKHNYDPLEGRDPIADLVEEVSEPEEEEYTIIFTIIGGEDDGKKSFRQPAAAEEEEEIEVVQLHFNFQDGGNVATNKFFANIDGQTSEWEQENCQYPPKPNPPVDRKKTVEELNSNILSPAESPDSVYLIRDKKPVVELSKRTSNFYQAEYVGGNYSYILEKDDKWVLTEHQIYLNHKTKYSLGTLYGEYYQEIPFTTPIPVAPDPEVCYIGGKLDDDGDLDPAQPGDLDGDSQGTELCAAATAAATTTAGKGIVPCPKCIYKYNRFSLECDIKPDKGICAVGHAGNGRLIAKCYDRDSIWEWWTRSWEVHHIGDPAYLPELYKFMDGTMATEEDFNAVKNFKTLAPAEGCTSSASVIISDNKEGPIGKYCGTECARINGFGYDRDGNTLNSDVIKVFLANPVDTYINFFDGQLQPALIMANIESTNYARTTVDDHHITNTARVDVRYKRILNHPGDPGAIHSITESFAYDPHWRSWVVYPDNLPMAYTLNLSGLKDWPEPEPSEIRQKRQWRHWNRLVNLYGSLGEAPIAILLFFTGPAPDLVSNGWHIWRTANISGWKVPLEGDLQQPFQPLPEHFRKEINRNPIFYKAKEGERSYIESKVRNLNEGDGSLLWREILWKQSKDNEEVFEPVTPDPSYPVPQWLLDKNVTLTLKPFDNNLTKEAFTYGRSVRFLISELLDCTYIRPELIPRIYPGSDFDKDSFINADSFYSTYTQWNPKNPLAVFPSAGIIGNYPMDAWNPLYAAIGNNRMEAPGVRIKYRKVQPADTYKGELWSSFGGVLPPDLRGQALRRRELWMTTEDPSITEEFLNFDDPQIGVYDEHDEHAPFDMNASIWNSVGAPPYVNPFYHDNWGTQIINSQRAKCLASNCCPPRKTDYVRGEMITEWPWCYQPKKAKPKAPPVSTAVFEGIKTGGRFLLSLLPSGGGSSRREPTATPTAIDTGVADGTAASPTVVQYLPISGIGNTTKCSAELYCPPDFFNNSDLYYKKVINNSTKIRLNKIDPLTFEFDDLDEIVINYFYSAFQNLEKGFCRFQNKRRHLQ